MKFYVLVLSWIVKMDSIVNIYHSFTYLKDMSLFSGNVNTLSIGTKYRQSAIR